MRFDDRLRQYVNATLVLLTPDIYKPEWTDWEPAEPEAGAIVVFTAADSHYLRKYGPAFLASLVRNEPRAIVPFHLYDPDWQCLALLAEWRSRFPDAHIGHS